MWRQPELRGPQARPDLWALRDQQAPRALLDLEVPLEAAVLAAPQVPQALLV